MIAEALDIARETYFAILLDRQYDGPVMIGSPVGGVDIEEVMDRLFIFKKKNDLIIIDVTIYYKVAEKQPDKIFKVNLALSFLIQASCNIFLSIVLRIK